MAITATELKNNLGKYLELAEKEDVFITKNGKVIVKLCSPYKSQLDSVHRLYGIIKDDGKSDEELRDERIRKL